MIQFRILWKWIRKIALSPLYVICNLDGSPFKRGVSPLLYLVPVLLNLEDVAELTQDSPTLIQFRIKWIWSRKIAFQFTLIWTESPFKIDVVPPVVPYPAQSRRCCGTQDWPTFIQFQIKWLWNRKIASSRIKSRKVVPLNVTGCPLLYLVLLNFEDVAELAEGEWRVGPELELGPVVGGCLLQRTVPEQCHQSVNPQALSNPVLWKCNYLLWFRSGFRIRIDLMRIRIRIRIQDFF